MSVAFAVSPGSGPSGSDVGDVSFVDDELHRAEQTHGADIEVGPYVEQREDGAIVHYPRRIGVYARILSDL